MSSPFHVRRRSGRTLAATGKTDEAREEYKKLLDEWKDADPDLEKVKELRAEFARLQT